MLHGFERYVIRSLAIGATISLSLMIYGCWLVFR